MTHTTPDPLREAAQAVLDRWDSLDWKAAPTADYMNRLRAALAATPQPAPADSEAPALLPCPFCGSAPSLVQALPSGWAVSCAGCGVGSGIRYSLMEDARPLVAEQWNRRAALAAAPQTAPAPAADERAAMIEVIVQADDAYDRVQGGTWAGAIADALLAAGYHKTALAAAPQTAAEIERIICDAFTCDLRGRGDEDGAFWQTAADALLAAGYRKADACADAPETLAWAVVVDGDVVWVDAGMGRKRDVADIVAEEEGGKPVRVAIRVVEDEA